MSRRRPAAAFAVFAAIWAVGQICLQVMVHGTLSWASVLLYLGVGVLVAAVMRFVNRCAATDAGRYAKLVQGSTFGLDRTSVLLAADHLAAGTLPPPGAVRRAAVTAARQVSRPGTAAGWRAARSVIALLTAGGSLAFALEHPPRALTRIIATVVLGLYLGLLLEAGRRQQAVRHAQAQTFLALQE